MSTADCIEYRDILDFPGYRVDSEGNVWSCRGQGRSKTFTAEYHKLKPGLSGSGYLQVYLCRGPAGVSMRQVHCLVLSAFVGPCPPGHQARHFPDRDKTNNRLANLSWATPKVNIADKLIHHTDNRGARNPNAKLTAADVLAILAADVPNTITTGQLGKKYGVDYRHIWNIRRGRRWSRALAAITPEVSGKSEVSE